MNNTIIFPKVLPVTSHTNYVGSGSTFVAVKGFKEDGADYISLAIKKGAKKVIAAKDVNMPNVIKVDDPRLELAKLSAKAWGYPAKKLRIIGVTGTKGKSTTVFFLEKIFRSAGYKTALLSSIYNMINGIEFNSNLTTEHPDYLHAFFSLCLQHKVDYVIMEVSAQALSLKRTYGLKFDGVIFTNFSLEHSEFYSSQEEYFQAKLQIFNHLKKGASALVNLDDRILRDFLKNNSNRFLTYSLNSENVDYNIKLVKDNIEGLYFAFKKKYIRNSYLLGRFNVYNLLASAAMACEFGIDPGNELGSLKPPPGRLNLFKLSNNSRCYIDFAHNPSSFKAVLKTLRNITKHLIVVFGAGGDRDRLKRPIMGEIASEIADIIILTSDNPRTEDPNKIIEDIILGIPQKYYFKVIKKTDREVAIRKAYELSKEQSVIALLGKGNETYQIINDKILYFNERDIIRGL